MNRFIGKPLINLLKLRYSHFRCVSNVQHRIKDSYYFMPGDILLTSSTLGQVLDQSADKCGDQAAFISDFQGISKSYSELRYEAERLASGLISLGLKKGDRIGICSPNCYEWPLTQFAAAKAGLILVNINPAFQAKELEYCLKKVGCRALIIWDFLKTQNFYQILCEIIPDLPTSNPSKLQDSNLPNLDSVIMISEDRKDGVLNFKDVFDSRNKESDKILGAIEKSLQFDDPLTIQFTSGTTGSPKGALLSHHNSVNNALVSGRRFGFSLFKPVICCHLPLFHAFGCILASVASVMYQGTTVFPSVSFDALASLKIIQNYKCTSVFGTPTMYVDLLHNYNMHQFNVDSLQQAVLGGAASPETLVNDVQTVLKLPYVQVGYGSTELSPAVAGNEVDDQKAPKGILKPMEYVELKIVDDKGHLVPVNTQGELCARGHVTFIGYWDEEKKTAEVLDKTNWYHTGDLCVMDEYGCIRVVGRIKDMIIRGGENIYPQEIENFLNSHPAVLEVHVCGVPDKRMGEEICAWISIKKDMSLTEEEIKSFCKKSISHFKIPRYIMFVTDFPKTQSGKIKKFEMSKTSIEKLKL